MLQLTNLTTHRWHDTGTYIFHPVQLLYPIPPSSIFLYPLPTYTHNTHTHLHALLLLLVDGGRCCFASRLPLPLALEADGVVLPGRAGRRRRLPRQEPEEAVGGCASLQRRPGLQRLHLHASRTRSLAAWQQQHEDKDEREPTAPHERPPTTRRDGEKWSRSRWQVCEGPGLKKEVTGFGGAELQMEPEEEGGGGVIYIYSNQDVPMRLFGC